MTIKKAYVEIVELLEANKDAKVKTIMAEVIELASAQRSSSETTSIRNTAGDVVAIRDGYSDRWCPLVGDKAVEFGVKANTSTGYNPMTKLALNQHNKQQRQAKQDGADLLQAVAKGDVKPTEIDAKLAEIEEIRTTPIDLNEGFKSKDGVVKYLEKSGEKLDEKSVESAV